MTAARVVAVDLGAASGRVVAASVTHDRLHLHDVTRFPNGPVEVRGRLLWDVLRLHAEILDGLRAAGRSGPVDAIGIDSWAIDHGLLDERGELLANPVHYRDRRTEGVMERVLRDVPADELFAVTGLQQLPFTTIYQLVAALGSPALAAARTMLLVPDLLGYWLTGEVGAEATNASTTQLYDVRRQEWAPDLAERVGIPAGLLPPLRRPGDVVGPLLPEVAGATGLPTSTPVVAVGSHDTASAVVGVPADGDRFAYVSCGTWALVGVELPAPVLTEASRLAGFTNETGVDATIRYLRNVMGLWLLQECVRAWESGGERPEVATLVRAAADVPAFTALIDVDDPAFLPPGDMPGRIGEQCRSRGEPVPTDRAGIVRCILDSLALSFRRAVRQAQELSGRAVDVVHVVGGGARNALLCQLTADACGLVVLAGPAEATAIGNALVQARAVGVPLPDLAAMRDLVRRSSELRTYRPGGDPRAWARAEERVFGSPDGGGGCASR